MQQNISDLRRQMREALRLTFRRYSPFYLAQDDPVTSKVSDCALTHHMWIG